MDENQLKETRLQARGCFQLIDLAMFAFGAFIMFGKTANLLGKFAPPDWLGFSPADYGYVAAVMIEGYLVMMKFKAWILPPKNFVEWGADIVVTIAPFVLSAYAQAADSWFTTNLIASMTPEEQLQITTIVSFLIPALLLLGIFRTAIETAPVGLFDNIKTGQDGFSGVVGFFRRLLHKENTVFSQEPIVSQLDVPSPDLSDKNGKATKAKTANPT